VGFPIRKFTDQSLFAAPHDLSQRTTSFFASQRQGIHQIPLRHLIALITNAHASAAPVLSANPPSLASSQTIPVSGDPVRGAPNALAFYKDQFCFKHIQEACGQASPTTEMPSPDDGIRMTENGYDPLPAIHPHPVLAECVSSLRWQ
jgi:hypothetical protein